MNSRSQTRQRVDTVIIGAGHNGLAVSHCLGKLNIDHVILERGEVANTWRRERWDSLRLLTPNWQCALPGYRYEGMRPKDFMAVDEVITFIADYARFIDAPLYTGTTVRSLRPSDDGYLVLTNRGCWQCRAVVMASGAFNIPVVPALAAHLPRHIEQLTAHHYRHPAQLAEGGVLVVGASATGLQLTQEIQQSGRPVTLCVGEHVRLPRHYRGQDILWWMNMLGVLDESYQDVDDPVRARHVPSPQLVGGPEHATLDLNALQQQGVQVVGRLSALRDGKALFSGALSNICKLADLKMARLLKRIDQWIVENPWDEFSPAGESPEPTRLPSRLQLELDLQRAGINTVVWACGFRPDYAWLEVPVLDHKGRLKHDGGITPAPGLYAMGLPFMRRRKSSFMFGASDDAWDISRHLAAYLRSLTLGERVSVA